MLKHAKKHRARGEYYRVQTLPRTNVYQLALKFKEILIVQMNHVT